MLDRRCGWSTAPRAPTPPRLATMLSDADLLRTPLEDLTALARAVRDGAHGSGVTYSPKVFIPLTMLCRDRCGYCTFAKAPARVAAPYLLPEEVLAIAEAGRPRAATRPSSRWASGPNCATPLRGMAGRPRLRLDGRLPRRDVPARPRGDRPAPPRQRRRAACRGAGDAASRVGEPGDDARVDRRGPGRPPRLARQGAGPAAGHPGGGGRGSPSRSRRASWSASATSGRTSWPRCGRSRRRMPATGTCKR